MTESELVQELKRRDELIANLAAHLRRLCYKAVRYNNGEMSEAVKGAAGFLKKHGLAGSVLRSMENVADAKSRERIRSMEGCHD